MLYHIGHCFAFGCCMQLRFCLDISNLFITYFMYVNCTVSFNTRQIRIRGVAHFKLFDFFMRFVKKNFIRAASFSRSHCGFRCRFSILFPFYLAVNLVRPHELSERASARERDKGERQVKEKQRRKSLKSKRHLDIIRTFYTWQMIQTESLCVCANLFIFLSFWPLQVFFLLFRVFFFLRIFFTLALNYFAFFRV